MANLRPHKIELNPNNKQSTLFSQHCGYARVAYNCALYEFKAGLDDDNWMSLYDTKRAFNSKKFNTFEWSKSLSQNAAKNAIHDFYDAVKRWKSGQSRFPKYKRKNRRMSYTTSNGRNSVKVDDKRIQLPKIGWVRMTEHLRWDGDIIRVTISKRGERWFASILVETTDTGDMVNPGHKPAIGVDVGINSLATLDNEIKFENPKALKRYERKLGRLQRKFSRCVYQSQNWWKIKAKIATLHYRIYCIRIDAHHKATTIIVEMASRIGIESLNVSGMLKNRKLAKALSDARLSGFLTMIKYKALAANVEIKEADTFFASSKICSHCGDKHDDLTLSDRTFKCPSCNTSIDRDMNAAINLRNLAVSCTES